MAKNYSKALRAYVYSLLNGNVEDESSTVVPVANKPYNGIAYPHILIQNVGFIEDGTKDSHGGDYSIAIEVVTRYPINEGGEDAVDFISSAVLELLPVRKTTVTLLDTTGQLVKFSHANDTPLEDEDEQFRYFWKRMIFECFIIE